MKEVLHYLQLSPRLLWLELMSLQSFSSPLCLQVGNWCHLTILYPCRGTVNSVGSQRGGGYVCSLCTFSPQSSISKRACPTERGVGESGKGGFSTPLKRDHTSLSLCFNSKKEPKCLCWVVKISLVVPPTEPELQTLSQQL